MGGQGKYAIVSCGQTAENLNSWIKVQKEYTATKYPQAQIVDTVYAGEDQAKATQMATDLMNAHPDLTGLVGECTSSAPGVAQAVQDANKIGKVFTVGLGTPQSMKPYLAKGSSTAAILWNVENLGYLTAWTGAQLARGQAVRGDQQRQRRPAGDQVRRRRARRCSSGRRCRSPRTTSTSSTTDRMMSPSSDHAAARRQTLRGISKSFGAVRAIRSAEITIQAGRVHALVGENGAGKSTMIKILSGVEQADTGTIEFDGAPVSITGTGDAIALGIATVYQEPQLFPELTVSENIFTGREIRKAGRVAWAEQNAKVVELLELLGLPARYATVPVGELSIAEQQQVSIAKSLAGDAKVLILDEPSAILTDAEIEVLFAVVRRLTAAGVAVIYISHRLDELFRIADEVTVMRDGQTIGTYPIGDLDVRRIAELMVGGILSDERPHREIPDGEPVLVLDGLGRAGKFHDVAVEVRAGEIVVPVRAGRFGRLGDRGLRLRDRPADERPDAPARQADLPAVAAAGAAAAGSRCCPRTARSRGCSASSRSRSTSPRGTSSCCRGSACWWTGPASARSPRT